LQILRPCDIAAPRDQMISCMNARRAPAPHDPGLSSPSAVATLNDVQHTVWVLQRCQVTVGTVRVVLKNPATAHSPMHPFRSTGLLMVHAACGNTQWAFLRDSRDDECWFWLARLDYTGLALWCLATSSWATMGGSRISQYEAPWYTD